MIDLSHDIIKNAFDSSSFLFKNSNQMKSVLFNIIAYAEGRF